MKYIAGYAYHIKDDFFQKVNDPCLMKNKEKGNYRPTYYCKMDNNTGLLWMVPMSSNVTKYQKIYDKQVDKYGKCLTIVMGKYDGKRAAFLLQNMFPITEYYIDHVHTKRGNPVPVHTTIQDIINKNIRQLLQLIRYNKRVVFPDIKKIENIMLLEYTDDYVAATKETEDKDIEKENKEDWEIER